MESILNLIVNAENVRLILLAVLGYCGYMQINRRMDRMEYSLNKRIDDLKNNDFAHLDAKMESLNNTIEALTYALEKNGSLKKEDKDYVDSRLAR